MWLKVNILLNSWDITELKQNKNTAVFCYFNVTIAWGACDHASPKTQLSHWLRPFCTVWYTHSHSHTPRPQPAASTTQSGASLLIPPLPNTPLLFLHFSLETKAAPDQTATRGQIPLCMIGILSFTFVSLTFSNLAL